MADKAWKAEERKKCRTLGGERSGPTGRDTPDCDDSVHVALEVKHYKKYVFLTKDWEQAVENAAKVGKIPVLNVREKGRGGRDCVQLDLIDFIDMGGVWDSPTELVRISWVEFVALYHNHFNDKEN